MGMTAAAGASRLLLTTTESRVQIAAFLFIGALVELGVKPSWGISPRLGSWIATGMCTTFAILTVRWHLEGLCPHTQPLCQNPIGAAIKVLT